MVGGMLDRLRARREEAGDGAASPAPSVLDRLRGRAALSARFSDSDGSPIPRDRSASPAKLRLIPTESASREISEEELAEAALAVRFSDGSPIPRDSSPSPRGRSPSPRDRSSPSSVRSPLHRLFSHRAFTPSPRALSPSPRARSPSPTLEEKEEQEHYKGDQADKTYHRSDNTSEFDRLPDWTDTKRMKGSGCKDAPYIAQYFQVPGREIDLKKLVDGLKGKEKIHFFDVDKDEKRRSLESLTRHMKEFKESFKTELNNIFLEVSK